MSSLPMLPPDLPDPGKSPTPTRTVQRWDTFIGDIASGMPREEARKKSYVTRADVETMCRIPGGLEKQRYRDACLAGLRTAYSEFNLEEIFTRIAAGEKVADAHMAVMGTQPTGAWYTLINQDPDIRQMYRHAKGGAVIEIMEHVVDIADDTTRDVIHNDKGPAPNMAAVSRDKLRTDVRFRQAGLLNNQLFGEKKDQVNVQVNLNYAERLEEARARAGARGTITPKEMREAVDATFKPAPVEEDTSWMEDKPTEMVWREET